MLCICEVQAMCFMLETLPEDVFLIARTLLGRCSWWWPSPSTPPSRASLLPSRTRPPGFGWTQVSIAILVEHRSILQFCLNTGVNSNFGWTQVNFASLVEHRCPLQSVLIAGNLFQAQLLFTNLSFPSPLEWSWSPTRLFICFAFASLHYLSLSVFDQE